MHVRRDRRGRHVWHVCCHVFFVIVVAVMLFMFVIMAFFMIVVVVMFGMFVMLFFVIVVAVMFSCL